MDWVGLTKCVSDIRWLNPLQFRLMFIGRWHFYFLVIIYLSDRINCLFMFIMLIFWRAHLILLIQLLYSLFVPILIILIHQTFILFIICIIISYSSGMGLINAGLSRFNLPKLVFSGFLFHWLLCNFLIRARRIALALSLPLFGLSDMSFLFSAQKRWIFGIMRLFRFFTNIFLLPSNHFIYFFCLLR